MEFISTKKTNVIPIGMMIFIMVQPILDLATSFSKVILEINFTPGIIIRFLFIIIGGIYILLKAFEDSNFKYVKYLFLLAVFFIFNLFISYHYKPIFNLMLEVTAIGKIVYFIVLFFVFLLSFRELKESNLETELYPRNIAVSQLIVSSSMILSVLTNTSIEAYDGVLKSGNSGWFFAANELSTLLAICFPILVWFSLKQSTVYKLILSWILVLGSYYSLIAVGTKVGYLAVAITFVMTIIAMALEAFTNTSEKIKNLKILKWIFLIITSVFFIYTTPYTPVVKNTKSHINFVDANMDSLQSDEPEQVSNEEVIEALDEEILENPIREETEISDEEIIVPPNNNSEELTEETSNDSDKMITELMFSGRDAFQQNHMQDFNNAGVLQKIFGMGFAANYSTVPVAIERDFHDLFYQYGFLGLTLILSPFIFYVFNLIQIIIKNILTILNVKYILIISSILLGLGISFISGHAITAPAVSTYLALIMAFIIVDLENINKNRKKS